MIKKDQERKQRQEKLANLFFEMGMDLDLIEKVSGVDKRKIILKRINKSKVITSCFMFNNNFSFCY